MLPIFNVRIYGILISGNNVLVTDEIQYGTMITKFPGGGMNYGEGTHECLKREFMEELEIDIEVLNHFYTVDFFQPSSFHKDQQVISIYYQVSTGSAEKIITTEKRFDFKETTDKTINFRWLDLNQIGAEDFSLPIDRYVAGLLKINSGNYK